MANITHYLCKNGKTTYKVKIRLKGHRSLNCTFDNLPDAKAWEAKVESDIKFNRSPSAIDTESNGLDKIVLMLPLSLSEQLKSVAPRGQRSSFIISLLEEYFKKPKVGHDTKKLSEKRYVSVKHIPEIYPAFTAGGIRHFIHGHEKFNFTKCFKKVCGKVVIDLDEFEKWVGN